MKPVRVVVGVDGGAPSISALRWAAHEAELRHTDLTAVIVDSQVNLAPYAPVRDEPPGQRRAALRRILDEAITQAVGRRPSIDIQEHVEAGRVADVLAQYATGADLLVLGNGAPEQAESTLAPTIRSCIRRANCHIVVVNDRDRSDWSSHGDHSLRRSAQHGAIGPGESRTLGPCAGYRPQLTLKAYRQFESWKETAMSAVTPRRSAETSPAARVAHSPTDKGSARWVWAVARISLGWVFLWAFLDKTFGLGHETPSEAAWIDGGSPTNGFLSNAPDGPFADIFNDIAGATWADWLFVIGLLGIGVALILGIGMRIAAVAGTALLVLMWSAVLPPDNNPFMDEHLIYAMVLIGLALVGAGRTLGFGQWWSQTSLVRRYPWLT